MAWTTPTVRATGDLITASIWNTDLVSNLKMVWHVADETSFADKAVAAPTTLVTSGSVTLNGSQAVRIEFFSPFVIFAASAGAGVAGTFQEDASTSRGTAFNMVSGPGGEQSAPVHAVTAAFTPSSGSHTYDVAATQQAGTQTVKAGFIRTWVRG